MRSLAWHAMSATLPVPVIVPPSSRTAWSEPAVAGAVGATITFLGSWTPSLWGDEAASVMSAERSWSSLWAMLQNVDAVHGLYYALLHVWIDLFGAAPAVVRLPSALAVGVMIAGVFVLVNRMGGRHLAWLSALICVLIPRVSFMGAETRSAALATALAVWLTVVLVEMVRRNRSRGLRWVYGIGTVFVIHLFLYSALLLIVHALFLLCIRASRGAWRTWGIPAGIGLVLCVPFVLFAAQQRGQIEFLNRRDTTSPDKIFIDQWFGQPAFAVICWGLIVLATGAAMVTMLRRRRAHEGAACSVQTRTGRTALTILAVLWLVVPTALLLLGHVVAGPMYTGRYLSFSAPAAAILVALGIAALGRVWLQTIALAVVIAVSVPILVAQREPYAKFDSDWAEVAQIIGSQSEPGDGVIFDDGVRPSRKPRLALRLYPQGFTDLVDLQLVRPYDETAELWDEVAPLADVADRLSDVDRVWVVSRSKTGTADDEATLVAAGYRLEESTTANLDTVRLYVKE